MPCTTILVGKNATNDDGGFETKQVIVVTPKKQGTCQLPITFR